MTTAPLTYEDHPPLTAPRSLPDERRRLALRSLLGALASAPLHPAFVWLAPCSPWLTSTFARKR